jgi:hypothetical protein
MEALQIMPNQVSYPVRSYVEDAQVIELLPKVTSQKQVKNPLQFIESNTKEVDFYHLKNECVIPVFSKDNEVTISHTNFIETMQDAISRVLPNTYISSPDIRVSHLIKGRTPEALHKSVNELQDKDRTLYYERMAFVMEIPSISETIEGNRLNLTVGGVRAYNYENLFSKKIPEKFKIFIGFKNMVCCNLCISTNGYMSELRAMSCQELLAQSVELFQQYNAAEQLQLMSSFGYYSLTEHQFAQLVGKMRLYQCLPSKQKKELPAMDFGDGQLNIVARNYYQDDAFCRNIDGSINLWKVYNLFTEANKNSYIDTYLDRSVNATNFLNGISWALQGNPEYQWFIN